MQADELVRFLSTLRTFVSSYWQGRIDEVINRIGRSR